MILTGSWKEPGQIEEKREYCHWYDGLGSVIAVSNESGNAIEKYEYSVYGEVRIVAKENGQPRKVSIIGNPYRPSNPDLPFS